MPKRSGIDSNEEHGSGMRMRLYKLQSWIGVLRVVVKRPELAASFFQVVRLGGWTYAVSLAARKLGLSRHEPGKPQAYALSTLQKEKLQREKFRTIPYYLDPFSSGGRGGGKKIAVHLHLFYEDMTETCIRYLNHIPDEYDLFVSLPGNRDIQPPLSRLTQGLIRARRVVVENVPNRGRDIAPFIIQFGERLVRYDVIAHFHTKKSPHAADFDGWFHSLMNLLCGSENGVRQIFQLLEQDGRAVYPAGNKAGYWDPTGWRDNHEIARSFLFTHGLLDIDDFPFVEFPQGSMFWAKADCLKQFLSLPLGYRDFPAEPIPPDATLAHALERLILMFTTTSPGRNYRLEAPELSCEPLEYYEEQNDYSSEITHLSIKILAYYQPHFFSPSEPEKGEGTANQSGRRRGWEAVRSATPLFEGHYQQHIPHEDLGYYGLQSGSDLLEKQVLMMKKSGVHGLIFYLDRDQDAPVIEQPMGWLLAAPQIHIPFCFCWSPGNEPDQDNRKKMALHLIQYLIPFFKDVRYLRIDHRPLFFLKSGGGDGFLEDCRAVWNEECQRHEVPVPFLVGPQDWADSEATTPGMEAGLEDLSWHHIEQEIPIINQNLQAYWPLTGNVLDYGEVAHHCASRHFHTSLPYFRSLVTGWDEGVRPGEARSYVLMHQATPQKMQHWLSRLIDDAETRLSPDRRYIIVNGWNDWAQGANLEPDTKFGYGHLNAIGRALCDYSYDGLDEIEIAPELHLELVLDLQVLQRLREESITLRVFLYGLAQFFLKQGCHLTIHNFYLAAELQALGVRCNERIKRGIDWVLEITAPVIFPAGALETLVKMAIRHRGFHISATPCNDPDFVHEEMAPNFSIGYWQRSDVNLRPPRVWRGSKVCPQAIYLKFSPSKHEEKNWRDRVSTILRFHHGASVDLLMRALYSLLAQVDCRVQPWLALQDLTERQLEDLKGRVDSMPWSEDCRPVLRCYRSSPENPDLRSLMLNDSLQAVGRGYVAFLDYDDILFSHAYRTLLNRLSGGDKNATFGRVFSTEVDSSTGMILGREKKYTLGHSYQDYLQQNHAPLHSFMLNLDRVDLSRIHYFPDMRFLEDYYLTLQIFSPEETDWDSLRNDVFIGDYIHRRGDQLHTLALSDSEQKNMLLRREEYRMCEARVAELRQKLWVTQSPVREAS